MSFFSTLFEIYSRPRGFDVWETRPFVNLGRSGRRQRSMRSSLNQIFNVPLSVVVPGQVQAGIAQAQAGDFNSSMQQRAYSQPGSHVGRT